MHDTIDQKILGEMHAVTFGMLVKIIIIKDIHVTSTMYTNGVPLG